MCLCIYNPAGVLVAQAGTIANPVYEVAFTVSPTHVATWFSEYAEGSSNNKYLEIYNGTDAALSLDDFIVLGNYNGNGWSESFTFIAGATVAEVMLCFSERICR